MKQHLSIIAVALACVLPMAYILALSLVKRWDALALLPSEWHTAHWQAAVRDAALFRSVVVSVLISCVVAGISTSVGFLAGRFIARHPKRERLMLLAYVPFAVSPVVFAASAHIVFIKLGLASTVAGVILAQTIFGCAFAVIVLSGFWNDHVAALEDLARTLGAQHGDIWRYVLVPMARRFLLLAFLQTFLLSWFQYGLTLIIGGGVVQTLPMLVYSAINEANPYYAAVNAAILMLPALVMIAVQKNALVQHL
ncbi:MAG: ABC transporter permease subunit [Candidatus Kapabacteria bacterium]|nr:ABC transporter permease subunit [Candidatus Kapabacteria bacterium]